MSDSTYTNTRNSNVVGGSVHETGDGHADGHPARGEDVMSLLSRLVQRKIVPDLITANRIIGGEKLNLGPAAEAAWHGSGFNAERGERDANYVGKHVRMADVARFVRLLRSTGVDAAPALVDVLQARGISRHELYLDLLGPAARMIGDMWLDDECSFADVTMVVGRLQNILQSLRSERPFPAEVRDTPRILLSVAPGEQHSFAIAIVEAVFQDAGWSTQLSQTNDAEVLIDLVAGDRFDAVGLSLSTTTLTDVLRATILRMRAASLNRDLVVLVGGPEFEDRADLSVELGADARIAAGLDAAIEARQMVGRHLRMPV